MRRPCNKKEAPAEKHEILEKIEARVMLAPTSKRPEVREFVVDSGASMHTMSTKELSSDELDTFVVLTANGEEAQEYTFTI